MEGFDEGFFLFANAWNEMQVGMRYAPSGWLSAPRSVLEKQVGPVGEAQLINTLLNPIPGGGQDLWIKLREGFDVGPCDGE